MSLPKTKQSTTVYPTDYLADAERLITALRAQGCNATTLEQADTELYGFWASWHYWEFGTDRDGNDHDGLEAWQNKQELGRATAKFTQRLATLWVELGAA